MKLFSVGMSVHNFENEQTKQQLKSLLQNSIEPDFIIFHQKLYKRKLLAFINYVRYKKDKKDTDLQHKLKKIKKYNILDINSDKALMILNKYKPTILIANSGYIKKKTIKLNPEIYFINNHASLLPKYRGVNNIEWALWYNDPIYATIHRINDGIDEGDILFQEKIEISPTDFKRFIDFRTECQNRLCSIVGKSISLLLTNNIQFYPQEFKQKPMMQYYSMHKIIKEILEKKYNFEEI